MQGDNMRNEDVDKYLSQHLSGSAPREAFKQQTLRDSTTAFVRVQRRRSVLRRVELTAAAVLIAGIAFLGGRLTMPRPLPRSMDIEPRVAAEANGVIVPSDLVAWLDAARLFGQLGMQDRMARAIERAGKLLPVDAINMDSRAGQNVAADESIENQNKHAEPMVSPDSQPSVESGNKILAQTFGD
jgi:hypothetical protein